MVEFALVLPIMLLLLAGAIDLGRLFYAYVAVENAAKEGALFGARSPLCDDNINVNCGDPNNVVWHVHNEATNIGGQFSVNVACRIRSRTSCPRTLMWSGPASTIAVRHVSIQVAGYYVRVGSGRVLLR